MLKNITKHLYLPTIKTTLNHIYFKVLISSVKTIMFGYVYIN